MKILALALHDDQENASVRYVDDDGKVADIEIRITSAVYGELSRMERHRRERAYRTMRYTCKWAAAHCTTHHEAAKIMECEIPAGCGCVVPA